MNIFLREMKATWKSLLFWVLGMASLIGVSMWEYEGLVKSDNGMVSKILTIYPDSLKALFGMGNYDIGTLLGYYGIILSFVYITAGLHAVMLGANIIAKEERDKTVEFLISKPVDRIEILRYKWLAVCVNLFIMNLAVWIVGAATVTHYEHVGSTVLSVQPLLLLFQIFFAGLGFSLAAILSTPKAGQYAMFAFLGFYLLKFVADLTGAGFINYLTPFGFLGAEIPINGSMISSLFGVIVTITVFFAALRLVAKFYSERDMRM